MGRSTQKRHHHHTAAKAHTLPSSPTHSFSSSSSSDFEFTISLSPRKSSAALCPADELFYKGKLLPLHLSPRLSMVRTLLLSSSSTSSSSGDTATTASRDSTASHSSSDSSTADLLLHHHHHLDCDSSRPSSATDDEFKRLSINSSDTDLNISLDYHPIRKTSKYFSLSKFSSVFRKDNKTPPPPPPPPPPSSAIISRSANRDQEFTAKEINHSSCTNISQSFSGNLRYPRRRSCNISSCPSSMMSSPKHGESGFGFGFVQMGRAGSGGMNSDASSMDELQNAIQGAIAHCKNSMLVKNKNIYGEDRKSTR